MSIIEIKQPSSALATLISGFKKELSLLNNKSFVNNEEAILEEMNGYFTYDKVVIGNYEGEKLTGFAVLKQDQGIYWLDWMFVDYPYRGTACASNLFDSAEHYAISNGGEKLYIWVHPDNQRMLAFLRKKGYDSLNLIEVTKKDQTKGHCIEILGSELKY